MSVFHRFTDSALAQCRLSAWTHWAVVQGPYANLYMLCTAYFFMFKHWFC